MDEFCGSEFWNINKTWYSDDPEISTCFQQTVLIWTPCVFLWVLLPLELYYIKNSWNKNIPWGFLNISKLALTAALVLLTVVDIAYALSTLEESKFFPVYLYTPVIKIASFVLSGVLLFLNKKYGLRTSGLIFLFWMFFVIFNIPRVRTEYRAKNYRKENTVSDSWAEYQFVSFMISFATFCALWLLNCWADREPLESKYPKSERPCPELGASFLQEHSLDGSMH